LGGLLVGSGSSVLLDGHAKFVELAGILPVFRSNAFWDRLHALELGAGIEIAALFTAVQFGVALWASAVRIESWGEDRTAVGTARSRDSADHARRARTEVIILSARTAGGRALLWAGFSVFFFVIAVAAMAVLTIHKRLRASELLSGHSGQTAAAAAGRAKRARDMADLHLRNGETGGFSSFTPCALESAHTEPGKLFYPIGLLHSGWQRILLSGFRTKGVPTSEMQEMGQLCF